MGQYHTTTHIHNLEDIYSFRSKTYEMVEALSSEKTQASQLASCMSSCMKQLLRKHRQYSIETEIATSEKSVLLRFRVPPHPEVQTQMAAFFDESKETPNKEIHLSKRFFSSKTEEQLIHEASSILTQRTKEELAREVEAKNNELNVAKSIQVSMLPVVFPAFPYRNDIDIYATLIPAKEVGGDLYDFYFLDEQNLALVVGDVSGKGVPAALMMAVCKTLLKSRASMDKSTASILTHVNNEMAKDNKNYMFVTLFMAILNTRTGQLTYTNAGHNPTYIRKKTGELVRLSELHGPVIAAMEEMTYRQTTIQLDRDDILFAYTDGVVEAHNSQGELFSDSRLQQFLTAHLFTNPEQLIKAIISDVQTFETGVEQFDDITALCVEYKGTDMENLVRSVQFAIKNTLEDVQVAIQRFETFAEETDLAFPIVMKASIVFDELLSNIVKYGFMDKNEHFIEISVELESNKLLISFSDDGIPFNPFQTVPPDLSLPVEEREIGGLGIHLVRELMNEYGYKRNVNRNVVTMCKYLS